MGMFDYVDYKANCPICNAEITNWQTKEAQCHMDTIEPWRVTGFHAYCRECNSWLEATVDAEIEYVVKKCEITLTSREWVKL
jgi:hypothetical protein